MDKVREQELREQIKKVQGHKDKESHDELIRLCSELGKILLEREWHERNKKS